MSNNNLNVKVKNIPILEQMKEQELLSESFSFAMDNLIQSLINFINIGVMQIELKEVLQSEGSLKNLSQDLHLYEDKKLQDAYKIGMIKTIIEIVHGQARKEKQKYESDELLNELKSHKHLLDLINILYQKNSLTHEKLAIELKMSKSALTNMIHKTEYLKLYTVERRGKYKYYYSNIKTKEMFIRYGFNTQQKEYKANEVEDILNTTLLVLCDEIKHNEKVSYYSLVERLPILNTSKRKDVAQSLNYFVKTVNDRSAKKSVEPNGYYAYEIDAIQKSSDKIYNIIRYSNFINKEEKYDEQSE